MRGVARHQAVIPLAAALVLAGCATEAGAPTGPGSPDGPPSPAVVIDDRPLEEQLAGAIRDQNSPLVDALIAAGVDVNTPVAQQLSPLHVAVSLDSAEIVSSLVAAGADLEATTKVGYTPLLTAAQGGTPEVVQFLLDAGAETQVFTADTNGSGPLQIAAQFSNTPALETLLAAGLDPNVGDLYFDTTALSIAAFGGDLEAVTLLVEAGADVNAVNAQGYTARDYAAQEGHQDVVDYLTSVGAS